MENYFNLNSQGFLMKACLKGVSIPFRQEEWAGPSWQILQNRKWVRERNYAHADGPWHVLSFWGVHLKRKIECRDDSLIIHLQAHNGSSQIFAPEKLNVLLGIDTYMDHYPQWDHRFFPTMMRCEKEHFYGYFSSPQGKVLGIACPQPIANWSLHYNQLFSDGGHRVEGFSLELLSAGPLPGHHPIQQMLNPGETREWQISIKPFDTVKDALQWASQTAEAPVFCGDRLIFEQEEQASLLFDAPGPVHLICGDKTLAAELFDGKWQVKIPPMSAGVPHEIIAICGKKSASIHVCWRKKWSWYIRQAAEQAILKPQKASTHVESWYGYFSGLLAMRHFPDPLRDQKILDHMKETIPLVFDMEKGVPTHIPGRIQNTAGLISICADAWQATKDESWLIFGNQLSDYLIDRCQAEDGSFRSGSGIHYTCVIYIAKSLLELWQVEKDLPGYEAQAKKIFHSVGQAANDLRVHLDAIGTEGEHTFEDGMISCAFSQIAFFALYLPREERQPYIDAAETLLRKHRCLERMGSPDSRSRNTTIRYWEAQYDVLIPENMISSPHGWTAWKTYGVWYLYLLTGKTEYLIDLMETMGSCAQLMDADGNLRWAFCVDPQNHAGLWQEDPIGSGKGRLHPAVYGECYLPMISGWYRAPKDTPVFGYLGTYAQYDTDQGGCCDQDVHECFKAMGESVLRWGYVYEDEQGIHAINGRLEMQDTGMITFIPSDNAVCGVHWNLKKERFVRVILSEKEITGTIQYGWICAQGPLDSDLPMP